MAQSSMHAYRLAHEQDLARPYLPFRRLLSCASARAAAQSACAKSAQLMLTRARAPPAQELAACARKGSFRSMRPEKPSHAAAAARSATPASTSAATLAPCSTAPPAYPRRSFPQCTFVTRPGLVVRTAPARMQHWHVACYAPSLHAATSLSTPGCPCKDAVAANSGTRFNIEVDA